MGAAPTIQRAETIATHNEMFGRGNSMTVVRLADGNLSCRPRTRGRDRARAGILSETSRTSDLDRGGDSEGGSAAEGLNSSGGVSTGDNLGNARELCRVSVAPALFRGCERASLGPTNAAPRLRVVFGRGCHVTQNAVSSDQCKKGITVELRTNFSHESVRPKMAEKGDDENDRERFFTPPHHHVGSERLLPKLESGTEAGTKSRF